MSIPLDRIAYYWHGRGDSAFLTAKSDFAAEDQPLIDAGVFRVSKAEKREIPCPFGCGQYEAIDILPCPDGTNERYVCCSQGEGEKILTPDEYQLMEFVPHAYLKYQGCARERTPKRAMRKKLRPRSTKWIKTEREAVMDYANDAMRNKDKKMPYELCETVWRKNATEFEAAAHLPRDERGYKNAASLRSYFYRLHQKEMIRKTVLPYDD